MMYVRFPLSLRNVEDLLHSRDMISTAIVFFVPSLSRAMAKVIAPDGLEVFFGTFLFTGLIGVILVILEWRKGKIHSPFGVYTVARGMGSILFQTIPFIDS